MPVSAWFWAALASAGFASVTALLAKVGVSDVSSNLATAIRTTVVVVFAWAIAAATGSLPELKAVTSKTWLFLGFSGLATASSWLCYFYAIKNGPLSRVAALDKMSLPLTMIVAVLVFHERPSPQLILGALLMVAGALLTTR